jgi:hypothetical protein
MKIWLCVWIYIHNSLISAMIILKLNDAWPWFGLGGGYKSVNERRSSRVTIWPPHRYKLLCTWEFHQVFKYVSMFPLYASHVHAQIWWYHVLDLVLLVVINRSMRDTCLESQFDSHIDTNYCVHENFIKCLNISFCLPSLSYVHNQIRWCYAHDSV